MNDELVVAVRLHPGAGSLSQIGLAATLGLGDASNLFGGSSNLYLNCKDNVANGHR